MSAEITEQIRRLKKEKNAVILAHYYVNDDVQSMADYIGDSFYLSKLATTIKERTIVFCGVLFMGESAKILNPEKQVIMPGGGSDCPMAHMVDSNDIHTIRDQYPDAAVVCYINSSAEIKRHADVCVTSSNALKIVSKLPHKNIYFIPDQNLGAYIASKIPEKNFILPNGFCHVHTSITKENVVKAKTEHPHAKILAHPECTMDVLELADYIGSTAGIIEYASQSDGEKFIICTEAGVFYSLYQKNPNKKFYSVGHRQFCPNMKCVTLENVLEALEQMSPVIVLDEQIIKEAQRPLQRMLELAE